MLKEGMDQETKYRQSRNIVIGIFMNTKFFHFRAQGIGVKFEYL